MEGLGGAMATLWLPHQIVVIEGIWVPMLKWPNENIGSTLWHIIFLFDPHRQMGQAKVPFHKENPSRQSQRYPAWICLQAAYEAWKISCSS